MAVVEPVRKPIKAHAYVTDSISYILSPENRNGDEKCFKATCLNCENGGAEDLAKQFFEIRRAYNKDSERLAHHYVQSFSPNEKLTPELAHQIGVELAKKIAPDFQVIVSTHIDKDHIHNHIVLNSVNPTTGLKWVNNKSSLKSIWQESDKLCKQYGLTTIENQSGLRGIDQTTQKLAEKGKSWKVELCKTLDDATKLCYTKKQFIDYMERKGFEITLYSDRNITFHKIGEKKKIRADTLAKQFGDYYTKESLERLMGFYKPPKKQEPSETKKKAETKPFVSEFQKLETVYFRDNPVILDAREAAALQTKIKRSQNPLLSLLLAISKALLRRNKNRLDKKYRYFDKNKNRQRKKQVYSAKSVLRDKLDEYAKRNTTAGNIKYKDLVSSQGANYSVRISLSAVPKLYAYPFFFSAKLYDSYAVITVKEYQKDLLKTALGVEDEKAMERHNKFYSAKSDYYDLKRRAEQLEVKIEYLMIQPSQLSKIENEKDRYVVIPTEGEKVKLAFLPQNKGFILRKLYPTKYKSESDELFSVSRNSKVNTKLKAEALLGGQKMRYRILTKEQVEQLAVNTQGQDLFAVFNKNSKGENLNGQYNIAFKEEDQEKIETALNTPKTTKRKI